MSIPTKPISPQEVLDNLDKIIPQAIIKAVNELLADKFRGSEVSIKQKDIISRALSLDDTLTENKIFKNNYLDFEKLYNENGWNVSYDKPGFSESYDAFFIFKPKSNGKSTK